MRQNELPCGVEGSMVRLSVVAGVFLLAACAAPPRSERSAVYFERWSANLAETAQADIAAAAARANQQPNAPVQVVGYADPEGSPLANKDLSRTRAQVVTDALVKDGVAPSRIQLRSVGSVTYAADSLESRRVEIIVGAP
jgi:outer membrane protein OmpA-like peptidoglycan-associated protein